MAKKITYTDEPLGDMKVVADFFPSPAEMDAHVIAPHEYDELPEITDEMLARATVNKGGRPRLVETKKLISLRPPK